MTKTNKEFITLKQVQEIFNMQNSFNKRVIPEWEDAPSWNNETIFKWAKNQTLASTVEFVELIDSTPWKWWKAKDEIDLQNLHVEIIDMLHFIVSVYIAHQQTPEEFYNDANHYSQSKSIMDDQNSMFMDLFPLVTDYTNYSKQVKALMALCQNYQLTGDELYDKYMLKNKVNHSRQDKGYSSETKDPDDCRHI